MKPTRFSTQVKWFAFALVWAFALPSTIRAEDKADLAAIYKIKDEGLNRSQVMDILSYLTDVFGPRISGAPAKRRAGEWVQQKLREWGLQNVHTESYEMGRSWELKRFQAHMVEPVYAPLIALPKAWTPATAGVIRGEAVRADIAAEADFEKYRGKLKGKFVLTQPLREVEPNLNPDSKRYSEADLAALFMMPEGDQAMRRMRAGGFPNRELQRKITQFYVAEGVAALLDIGRGEDGTLFVGSGGDRGKDAPPVPPQATLAVEHYNRICRILDKKINVTLELEVQAEFSGPDTTDENIIGEIPGSDKKDKDQVVIIGGQFDSWHGATGAADDAVGCAAAMEAMRILKAANLKPRRTIRIGLWGGEEIGLMGSRAYVAEHYASRPTPPPNLQRGSDDFRKWMQAQMAAPLTLKKEYGKLCAYFNVDNGGGRIRGIYLQGNDELRPIFETWAAPFRDMGVSTVTIRRTGGTDHQSFDGVGLPGFQFIQDELDYMTRDHHSNMDFYERVPRGDAMQIAVVMASFAYHAAMRPEMLPRKPLPAPAPPQVPAR